MFTYLLTYLLNINVVDTVFVIASHSTMQHWPLPL